MSDAKFLELMLLILKAWLKGLLWVSFVQFYLYSILNQRDKLFREKILQSTLSEKKEKFSAPIKKDKDFRYLTIKSEPMRKFNWKDSLKVLDDFFCG